jgi:hypothetical protein
MKVSDLNQTDHFRFSGHETFACRYAWLPKAAHAVKIRQDLLTASQEDDAMVELGVGKNMVRSIRYWAEAAGVIQPIDGGHAVTQFGADLLMGHKWEDGKCLAALDPYLEDIQTLWLLHWKMTTNPAAPLFAWDFLMNRFQEPELFASTVVRAFERELLQKNAITKGSLEQLWDVFLHSYVPTRGRKGEVREDNLDSPFIELDLLMPTGFTESSLHPGRIEAKYAFRREDKPEIGNKLFVYCLHEFWQSRYPDEQSMPLHMVANGHGSPGQVFKIPEMDIRNRLLGIYDSSSGYFEFEESATIPRIVQKRGTNAPSLQEAYNPEEI